MRHVLSFGLAIGLLLSSGACRSGSVEDSELLISAAASLTDVFTEMEAAFERADPGTDVVMNFAASSTLREQILAGAPVDVFASANLENMEAVVEAGEVSGAPEVFAVNRLVIAVPPGNPAEVDGLEDFADGTLLIGLCAEGVPCGDLAREALLKAGVAASVDSDEPDVRALLTKVELGELDAGITYMTDLLDSIAERVRIPDEHNVVAAYPIAVLREASHPDLARQFVDFVLSEKGQGILGRYGFASP